MPFFGVDKQAIILGGEREMEATPGPNRPLLLH